MERNTAKTLSTSSFGNRIGWGRRPALLLVDVCLAYWKEGSPLSILSNPAGAKSPESMRRLLQAAREHRVPVIWTEVKYTSPDMSDAGLFWCKSKALDVWRVGDPRGLMARLPGLEPREGEILVTKRYPSAFFGTTLATDLQIQGIDTLVVCGVSTSSCIRATVLDAMQHGFRAMIVGSACGDRTAAIHNANIFDMDAKNGDVVSEEEAIAHLRSDLTGQDRREHTAMFHLSQHPKEE